MLLSKIIIRLSKKKCQRLVSNFKLAEFKTPKSPILVKKTPRRSNS